MSSQASDAVGFLLVPVLRYDDARLIRISAQGAGGITLLRVNVKMKWCTVHDSPTGLHNT